MRLLLICLIRQKKIIPIYPIYCVFIMYIQCGQNVLFNIKFNNQKYTSALFKEFG